MEVFETARLDKYIRRKFGAVPQSSIEKALRNKDILVNGQKAKSATQVSESDYIFVHPNIVKLFSKFDNTILTTKRDYSQYLDKFKLMIIYEDDNLLVLNKPSGMAVQLGSGTNIALDVIAKEYNPELRLVHRIDKETSGLTIMAKNLITARQMLHLFQTKQVRKVYIAHLSSKIKFSEGVINVPLSKVKDKVVVDFENGKEAITKYKLIKNESGHSVVEVYPLTGRTHQIRVHFAHIGFPLLGDRKYGGKPFSKLCLHSSTVSFKLNGKNLKFEC